MANCGEIGKRVVVIGGGMAGSLIAKTLQYSADVTLIDPKEYFEITWANLRTMVEPSFGERTVINHRDYLVNARIITSTATNITENEVMTADGHVIPYDYLVIATGHTERVPKTRTERLNHYQKENQKIKSAKSILIVGGGPSGVELAAEIAVDYPDKKVTLVHKGSRLLEFIGPKAADKTINWLKSHRVEVKLGQSVDLNNVSDEGIYVTSAGETIQADCHFLCIGIPLGSSWLRETILKNKSDNRGRLMVDENLRVKGHKNIFAIGDITDIPEAKQGYLAQKHALVTAKNIKLLSDGQKESKLATYQPGSTIAIVSLGRKEAVAQFPFITISGCVPGMIKSKDLFVTKTRQARGLDAGTASSKNKSS
ncbi:apoptosis-inducing factor homolog B-like [Mangifera indica]|uniref:apoptosis-inducing factor homolog B-like n=1 Tax=Mangifera indica TaxID=29780 RepID=UPI001CFB0D3D|nr:apoptosis-inducing factor homolog B-like [Mangifera indica]